MLKRTKSCFVVRMRSYIIVEDQVHHLVILVGIDTVGGWVVIETRGGLGNHPIIIKSEKGILSRKEQFLHLPTRLEEKRKVGGGEGGLEDHSLTLGSLQHRTFPVRIP